MSLYFCLEMLHLNGKITISKKLLFSSNSLPIASHFLKIRSEVECESEAHIINIVRVRIQSHLVIPTGFEPVNVALRGRWVKPLLHRTSESNYTLLNYFNKEITVSIRRCVSSKPKTYITEQRFGAFFLPVKVIRSISAKSPILPLYASGLAL